MNIPPLRFWSYEAHHMRCVRENDYDALKAENESLRKDAKYWSEAHDRELEWSAQLIGEREELSKDSERYLGLLYMAKELLTTISRNGATMRPADWCENFKSEVADRIEKIDAAISSPEKP